MPKVNVPVDFVCPISQGLMNDPVLTADNKVYEQKSIEKWFEEHNTSPLTNSPLPNKNLSPALEMKQKIHKFKQNVNLCSFEDFLNEVKKGDLEKLKTLNYIEEYLVHEDQEKDEEGYSQKTPLHYAAELNYKEMAEYLINEGAKVCAKNSHHEKPLRSAARKGVLETLQILYKYSHDIESCDHNNFTALHCASQNGYFEIVQFLIENKANVNAKDTDNGRTPFLVACKAGHLEIIDYLVVHGADITDVNLANFNALHYAAFYGKEKTIEYLLQRFNFDLEKTTTNSRNALHLACTSGNEATVRLLLTAGASVFHRTEEGNTALHIAAIRADCGIIKALIEKGADYRIANFGSKTALDVAQDNNTVKFIVNESVSESTRVLTKLQEALQKLEEKNKKLEESVIILETRTTKLETYRIGLEQENKQLQTALKEQSEFQTKLKEQSENLIHFVPNCDRESVLDNSPSSQPSKSTHDTNNLQPQKTPKTPLEAMLKSSQVETPAAYNNAKDVFLEDKAQNSGKMKSEKANSLKRKKTADAEADHHTTCKKQKIQANS